MRKIVVTMWITLDGFIARSNGEIDWILGDDEMAEYELEVVRNSSTLLFGRKTFNDFASYWPHVANNPQAMEWELEHSKNMNARQKVVISSEKLSTDWEKTQVLHKLEAESIQELKSQPGQDILIYGSASIIQQLTNLNLIDEYQLLIHPIILGDGKRLFEKIEDEKSLKLVESRKFKSGVMLLTYGSLE